MRVQLTKPKRLRRRSVTSRSGTAAVELAVVLPLLVTIVLGCVDFGRFAHSYIAVTNAACAAAEFASTNPYTTATEATWKTQVRQAAVDEMTGMVGFDSSKLTMATPVVTKDPNGLQRVKVEISYPFKTIVTWPSVPSNTTLKRAVEMRAIRW